MSEARCPLCTAVAASRFQAGGHNVVRCEGCDLEWVHPTPTAGAVQSVYEDGYFAGNGCGYEDYFAREHANNLRKAVHRSALLGRMAPGARWLDVGAADGTFVAAAAAAGFDAFGVEVSVQARAAAAQAVKPRLCSSLEEAEGTSPFAVITLWDVLEHLPAPMDQLSRLASWLGPQGLLAVVVPVIDNWNARHDPSSWDQYKPPEHLTYFSTTSLRCALTRYVGPVIHEEPAWVRYGRRHLLRGQRGVVAAVAARAEQLAVQLGLATKSSVLDSVLMVAQAGKR